MLHACGARGVVNACKRPSSLFCAPPLGRGATKDPTRATDGRFYFAPVAWASLAAADARRAVAAVPSTWGWGAAQLLLCLRMGWGVAPLRRCALCLPTTQYTHLAYC